MGVFDYLRCHYPLPLPEVQHLEFQTKDTFSQYLNDYEIREDGTLWHQAYDVEDHSDPNATGALARMAGCMARVNKRWERVEKATGEIVFYACYGEKGEGGFGKGWVEFSAYFVDGKLNQLHLLEHRPPPEEAPNG